MSSYRLSHQTLSRRSVARSLSLSFDYNCRRSLESSSRQLALVDIAFGETAYSCLLDSSKMEFEIQSSRSTVCFSWLSLDIPCDHLPSTWAYRSKRMPQTMADVSLLWLSFLGSVPSREESCRCKQLWNCQVQKLARLRRWVMDQ